MHFIFFSGRADAVRALLDFVWHGPIWRVILLLLSTVAVTGPLGMILTIALLKKLGLL